MTHFDDIYEIAVDNYGLVTYAQARGAGLVGAELNRYVADGRLRKVARGKGLLKKCEAEALMGELGYDVEGA